MSSGKISVVTGTSTLVRRSYFFFLLVLGSIAVFSDPLKNLIRFALIHEYGSHILVVVPVSAWFIHERRHVIFSKIQSSARAGTMLLVVASAAAVLGYRHPSPDGLSLQIGALVGVCISAFLLCYGMEAFRRALFPLLFLLLLIPMPESLLDPVTYSLQSGSATVADWLFRALGIPVFRQGMVFLLPSISIEVAKQCSGIRSSIALLITVLIAGELLLRSPWRKFAFILSIVPIAIFKNAVRIVTVSVLTIYVDRAFLYGSLHTSGGILFYALGLLALVPIIVLLRRGELRNRREV